MKSLMSRRALLAGSPTLICACAHVTGAVAETEWEHKQISAGANRPEFAVETSSNTEVLVALHNRTGIPRSPEHAAALTQLRERGLVKAGAQGFLPAVTVAGLGDGPRWFAVSDRLRGRTAALIQDRLPQVRAATEALEPFSRIGFDQASFFVLSNVLLDSWQINAVEQCFIRAERPERSGGRYYYALLERIAASETEAFGIYGNQFYNFGDVAFGLYGNRRLTPNLLPRLSLDDIRARFAVDAVDANAARAALARRLAQAARGEVALAPREVAALQHANLADDNGALSFPVLREADYIALNNVASLIIADLVSLLEAERSALNSVYARSPYAEETTFEEYLIWWYHFFYTEVTDRLAALGVLRIPANGVMTYIVTE